MPIAKKPVDPVVKKPRAKKAEVVSKGKVTLGEPGAPKAKRALKEIIPNSADPLPGRPVETERLIGRLTPVEGFNDYTVAITIPGGSEAIRYFGVQVDLVKGKRLSKEKLANEVVKLALHYENVRSHGKFGRGMASVTAIVVRQPQEGIKLAVFSFTYRALEAMAF